MSSWGVPVSFNYARAITMSVIDDGTPCNVGRKLSKAYPNRVTMVLEAWPVINTSNIAYIAFPVGDPAYAAVADMYN